MDLLRLALSILEKYPLCDHCLGRQFAVLARGTTNEVRGFSIKLLLTMDAHLLLRGGNLDEGLRILRVLALNGGFKLASDLLVKFGYEVGSEKSSCYICNNIFDGVDEILSRVVKLLSDYEFSTFLVGSKIPGELAEREDRLRSEFSLDLGESFKSEFNRFLGKLIQSKTGKSVSFESPDVVVLVDLVEGDVHVESKPLFIYGRYRKLVRGIPQSTWICSRCGGVGCEECNFTGRRYSTSIEEIICKPILELTVGEDAVFHGAGREDVDARMLGSGRPFVVEIKRPKRRFIDLDLLQERINNSSGGVVEVSSLKFSSRQEIRRLKNLSPFTKKTYRVLVKVEGTVDVKALSELESYFNNREIRQQTPLRVLHRRADKMRVKKVYSVKCKLISPSMFEAIIECQGGLYVKELISGDVGRTKPNFSDFLGVPAVCVELDVLDVSPLG